MLKDLFDRVCDFTANTVTGYEGDLNTLDISTISKGRFTHRIYAAVLGW